MIYCGILDLSRSLNNHEELQIHTHIGHNENKLFMYTITLTENVSSRLSRLLACTPGHRYYDSSYQTCKSQTLNVMKTYGVRPYMTYGPIPGIKLLT